MTQAGLPSASSITILTVGKPALEIFGKSPVAMAAQDPDNAMQLVGQLLHDSADKLREDVDDAKLEFDAAYQSRKALQRFHSDLWPKKVNLVEMIEHSGGWRDGVDPWTRYPGNTWRVATGSLVQGGGRVDAEVTAGIAKVFQEHMTVLADCRYKAIVASLLKRVVALDEAHDILASAMADIYTRINDLGLKERDIDSRIKHLEESRLGMRLECNRFRCTCKTYQHFVLA